MALNSRFATLLWALILSVLSGHRVMAQTTEPDPILEVEGTLQFDDEILDDGSFYDVHEFSGRAGQTVTVLLESSAFDVYLILEDDQGNRIAAHDDIRSGDTNAALIVNLPTTGRYRIFANAKNSGTQGPYRLRTRSTLTGQPNSLLSAGEVTLLEADQRFKAGFARYRASEFQAALVLWEEALDLFRTEDVRTTFPKDGRQSEAKVLRHLGSAYSILGEYKLSLGLYQHSLGISRENSDRQGEAKSLLGLGNTYNAIGEHQHAIEFYQKSLKINQEIKYRLGEANSLGHLGVAYQNVGKYTRAINFLQQQFDIAREIGYQRGEANSLGNLGVVYHRLGEYRRAIDFYQEAYNIRLALRDLHGLANSLANLGLAYDALDEDGRAIDFYQQALEINRKIGYRRGEANSLVNLGLTYVSSGEYDHAIDFQQQALDINQAIGDRQGEANSLSGLGLAYASSGEYERAIDFYQQALDIDRAIGNRHGESMRLHNLGLAFLGIENLTEAERYFQSSTYVQESLHSGDLANANQLSLLDSQQNTYRLLQLTLVAQGQTESALEVAERGRAQALAASMARSLDLDIDPPNLEQIQAIASARNATLVEYSVLPSGRILIWVIQPDGTIYSTENDATALDDSLLETTDVFATLGQNSRGTESTETLTPLSNLVQDTQAALTRNGPSGSQSQISRQQLDTHLQELHELLIEPIAQWLPKDKQKQVIFIPHRELFRIPFTALRNDDGKYLIEKHTILTAPSIQSLKLTRQHRERIKTVNATDALIVGNPTFPEVLKQKYGWETLPGAEIEAQNVGNYLSQYLDKSLNVLSHNQATETLVKESLHDARFIHLATHGILASLKKRADLPGPPQNDDFITRSLHLSTYGTLASSKEHANLPGLQYSYLPGVLALAASGEDDGSLTADELLEITFNNPLNAELVVLSACQTGQGPITSDGVYGLSRTLLTAGVPTLVVSLWNASDTHTVDLMDKFYHQFLVEEQDKAQALRQAMLHMIEQGDDNPQYWAAFTLVGQAE